MLLCRHKHSRLSASRKKAFTMKADSAGVSRLCFWHLNLGLPCLHVGLSGSHTAHWQLFALLCFALLAGASYSPAQAHRFCAGSLRSAGECTDRPRLQPTSPASTEQDLRASGGCDAGSQCAGRSWLNVSTRSELLLVEQPVWWRSRHAQPQSHGVGLCAANLWIDDALFC